MKEAARLSRFLVANKMLKGYILEKLIKEFL
jgi:hypothetical protein